MNLSDDVGNPALVISVLGSWPSFHDAEVLSVRLSRNGEVAVHLTVKAMPYDPSGKISSSLIELLFRGVEDVQLSDFNNQNALWDLTVEQNEHTKKLKISASYGLAGSFSFTDAEILDVKVLRAGD